MSEHINKHDGLLERSSSPRELLSHWMEIGHRADIIDDARKALMTGKSVLLVGEEGVGKTRIIAELDSLFQSDETGSIKSLTSNEILAGSVYVGEWQSKLRAIMDESKKQNIVLHLIDLWAFPEAGSGSSTKNNFWEMLEPEIQKTNGVQIIAEASLETLDELGNIAGMLSNFEILKVPPYSNSAKQDILTGFAQERNIRFSDKLLEKLCTLAETFMPHLKGLKGSFKVIDSLRAHAKQSRAKGSEFLLEPSEHDVESVIMQLTGLPEFVVSSKSRLRANDIKRWFRERIIGQSQAIDALIETIALYKAGMKDPGKPIGTFMFVGPSGVGKTETAKALAEFLFGSADNMLRFDMSEFGQYGDVGSLIGSANDPARKARLLDPVRANPFQVILFDELEKASIGIHDVMLQLLDEGRVSPPTGSPVDFRHTIFIATSNAGAEAAARAVPGFGGPAVSGFDNDRALQEVENHFRPELLNRFQNIIPFRPLTRDQALMIAEIELKRILKREGLVNRDISVDIEPGVLKQIVDIGYDVKYGGRALQRAIQKKIVLPIALTLMERAPPDGSIIQVHLREGEVAVGLIRGEDDRPKEKPLRRAKSAMGERLSIDDIPIKIQEAETKIEILRSEAKIAELHAIVQEVDEERMAPGFWDDAKHAASRFAVQARYQDYVQSFHALQDDLHALSIAVKKVKSKWELEKWVRDFDRYEARCAQVRRQLVLMGEEMDYPALIRVTPLNDYSENIHILHQIYNDWAKSRKFDVELFCEPVLASEQLLMRVTGSFAYGYLRSEAGLHRVRSANAAASVFRVDVVMWDDVSSDEKFQEKSAVSQAISATSLLGRSLRSRIEVPEQNIVLQNAKSIYENNESLPLVIQSLKAVGPAHDGLVRTYELDPFLLHDPVGLPLAKKKVIGPELFHELLCARIDSRDNSV